MSQAANSCCTGQNMVLRLEARFSRILEQLLTATFMLIFALVVLLVLLRYVFNTTIVGGNEATVMLFIWTTALGAAVDLARGKHIVVDAFVNYVPAVTRRWLDVVNLLIIGILNAYLLKYGIDWITAVGGSEHPVLHVPEAVAEIALPVGCGLTILFCITRIVSILMANPAAAE